MTFYIPAEYEYIPPQMMNWSWILVVGLLKKTKAVNYLNTNECIKPFNLQQTHIIPRSPTNDWLQYLPSTKLLAHISFNQLSCSGASFTHAATSRRRWRKTESINTGRQLMELLINSQLRIQLDIGNVNFNSVSDAGNGIWNALFLFSPTAWFIFIYFFSSNVFFSSGSTWRAGFYIRLSMFGAPWSVAILPLGLKSIKWTLLALKPCELGFNFCVQSSLWKSSNASGSSIIHVSTIACYSS